MRATTTKKAPAQLAGCPGRDDDHHNLPPPHENVDPDDLAATQEACARWGGRAIAVRDDADHYVGRIGTLGLELLGAGHSWRAAFDAAEAREVLR